MTGSVLHPTMADAFPNLPANIRVDCPGNCGRRLFPKQLLDLEGQGYPSRFLCWDDMVSLDGLVIEAARLQAQDTKRAEKAAYQLTVEYARAQALARLGDLRWQRITYGFSFIGVPIELNEETKANISGAFAGMELETKTTGLDPTPVDWQVTPGTVITLDYAAVSALSLAAYQHVQACFAKAKELTILINAAETPEAVAAIDLTSVWSL